jgi:hypothetical protein
VRKIPTSEKGIVFNVSDIDQAMTALWHKILDTKGSLEMARMLEKELRPILVAGKACKLALPDSPATQVWDAALRNLGQAVETKTEGI